MPKFTGFRTTSYTISSLTFAAGLRLPQHIGKQETFFTKQVEENRSADSQKGCSIFILC